MKIRVVDYQANPGGGVRFTTELVRSLQDFAPEHRFELVSHGQALRVYAGIFRREGLDVPVRGIAPRAYWRAVPATRRLRIPGLERVKRFLGFARWYYDVPESVLRDCDVAWFPWLHRHRLPKGDRQSIVGSFHDAIVFIWPGLVAKSQLRDERATVEGWMASSAKIVVSSNATLGVLADALHIRPTRFTLVRVGWTHVKPPDPAGVQPHWPWLRGRYLLCPANTSSHKNHEVLFTAMGRWRGGVPLVLTGYGSNLPPGEARARSLRSAAEAAGLHIGTSIIPLGLVADDTYDLLLAGAWAVVMPTRLEGGGSFPVMEAVLSGIPVLCADIPVLREQMEQVGGRVLWFDPADPAQLASRLEELDRHYDEWRSLARDQVGRLRIRTWRQAAEEYMRVLTAAADGNK